MTRSRVKNESVPPLLRVMLLAGGNLHAHWVTQHARLHDLNKNGLLEIDELVQLNSKAWEVPAACCSPSLPQRTAWDKKPVSVSEMESL